MALDDMNPASDDLLAGERPGSMVQVLRLIARGGANSRADIARRTNLARSTVALQVDELLRSGVVEEVQVRDTSRGRPPRVLRVRAGAGVIVAVDVDTQETHIAVADLASRVLSRGIIAHPVAEGPAALIPRIVDWIRGALSALRMPESAIHQVVVGLPGPVDFIHGYAVRPPLMPGWDRWPVAAELSKAFDAPVTVDNDVNLMALGEASFHDVETPLLFVRVGTGIGAGLATSRDQVHRGADGAAGDIGHVRTPTPSTALCDCGKTGCLEATSSLRAILADLGIEEATEDEPELGVHTLAQRMSSGDAVALQRIRQAAAEIGQVISALVHFYNPRTLVLGGSLSTLRDEVLSGVRAAVYEYALPLATRKLVITTSQLDDGAVLNGALVLAAQKAFDLDGVRRLLTPRAETTE